MSVQIALLAPATRIASRKLGPTAGRRSASSPGRPSVLSGGLRREQVREHVRQVRDAGHQAVVGLRVDRRRARPEPPQQRVQPLVEHAGRAPARRRQVPGGAVEQILARVLDAVRLGARQRVTADEALVGRRVRKQALGRADVGDHAVRWRRGQRLRHDGGQRADGRGGEDGIGAADGLRDALGGAVDRAQLERPRPHARVRVVSADLRLGARAGGEADRAADQPHPEDCDPHLLSVTRPAPRRRCDRGRLP